MTRLSTDLTGRSDWLLRRLFGFAARGLPLTRISDARRPYTAHSTGAMPFDVKSERSLRRSVGSSGK